ncbi:MAG: hypothetical protein ACF8QF_02825 [Phycisphaerales bacterium]
MSTPDGESRAGALRLRFGLQSALVVLLATLVCVLGTWLATRAPVRFDMTATRAQSLSERTRRIVAELDASREIVVVADTGAIAPGVWQRATDVLDTFDRASDLLRVTVIDVTDAGALDDYALLLDRLATMYGPELERHVNTVRAAAEAGAPLAAGAESLGEALQRAAQALPEDLPQAEQLDGQAAVARLRAGELRRAGQSAGQALNRAIAGTAVPQVDIAKAELAAPLGAFAEEQALLVDALDQFAGALAQREQPGAAEVRAAADSARRLRDDAARLSDELERLGTLRLLSIVRAIEAQNAVIVISERDARAVRFDSLFPAQATIDEFGGSTADIRFVGEDLIATALASLAAESQPALVLAHSLPTRLLDESGLPRANEAGLQVVGLVNRLALRGIDVVEWPVALSEAAPPAVARLGAGDRPVVWCVIGVVAVTADAAARGTTLFQLVEELLDEGEDVLICASPSTLPGVGEPDPLVRPLAEAFGITVDTGRPLLERASSPSGPIITPSVTLRTSGADHAIGRAVSGLATELPWPTPMAITETPGVGAWPVLIRPDSDDAWGESRWLDFWSIPQERRNRLSDPPTPDDERDNTGGPWVLAAAAERSNPVEGPPQRVVVVGASGWFFDAFTQRGRIVDGRTVQVSPGNSELMELAVYWLSGRDEWIGASARSAEAPRIRPMSAAQVTALRWALIAGLPGLVLVIGAALRIARG